MKKLISKVSIVSLIILVISLVTIFALPCIPAQADSVPECWAVFVGVSRYQYVDDTSYCADGARELYQEFSPAWGEGHVKLLVDSSATKANILSAIDWLADNADAEDTVLFYFSGHGDDLLDGYFCPYDSLTYSYDNDISPAELDSAFAVVNAGKIVAILDCCFAGTFQDNMSASGRVIMMTSSSYESAYELDELEHAVFSYYILQAIDQFDVADSNQDFELSAEEIAAYAGSSTINYEQDHKISPVQHPVLDDRFSGELPLLEKFVFTTNTTLPSSTNILTLNGVNYTSAPPPQLWMPGVSYTMTVPQVVNEDSSTRYVFSEWNDGGIATTRTVSKGSFTPKYHKEYLLTINPNNGNPISTEWVDEDQAVSIPPQPSQGFIIQQIFTGWDSNITDIIENTNVNMPSPVVLTTIWRMDFVQLYVLLGIVVVLVVAVIITVVVVRRRRATTTAGVSIYSQLAAVPAAPAAKVQPINITPIIMPTPLNTAKLVLPDNSEINIRGTEKAIGRYDLDKIVPAEELKYISRQHIMIRTNGSQYYVEDRNSSNDTKINGKNITGKGKQELRDGDRIKLADMVTLQFRMSNAF